MTRSLRLLSLVVILILAVIKSNAQRSTEVVTGKFANISFDQLVADLESKTRFRFFYSQSAVDSLRINTEANGKSIGPFLNEIFAGTNLHFVIDDHKNIYITKGILIQSALPEDFFDRGDTKTESRGHQAYMDYPDVEKLEKLRLSEEERIYEIGRKTATIGTGNATVAGHLHLAETGEPVIGALIATESPMVGISTDQFGYYALTLPKGRHELRIKSMGMKSTHRTIILYGDGKLDIDLHETVTPLKEILVESDRDKNVTGMQMGLDKIDIRTMKKVPVVFGEVDVFKVMLALPGVQSVGEATSGLNVRGGATNQNLILFNDATIYNPTHLFGFFSAFNPDAVKSVELYKSGIPAQYGGRLSSVIDINSREGNKKKFSGSGGIGPLTGRLTLEGPLFKGKSSYLVGARTTYSDWLLRQIPNQNIRHSKAGFYDINFNANHEFNEKNSLYVTGYFSKDHFTLNSDTLYTYRNKNATVKWKHNFGNKLYAVFSGAYSGYDYSVTSGQNLINAFTLSYSINQAQAKADFSYFPVSQHSLNFGVSTIRYALAPGSLLPRGISSQVVPDVLEKEQAQESAIYLSDHYEVTPRFSIYAGLRYSLFTDLGPKHINQYASGLPKDTVNIIGTASYAPGKSIVTYQGPEYRLSMKYSLSDNSSVKVSYNRMRQYLQMLTNTAAISPTDIWKLSDPNIKPQIGDQYAVGLYKNLRSNTIETSIEGYYKSMQNSLDYKNGAVLLQNHHIETDIANTQGKAYGVEFMVKKMNGKLNGWVTYTYSRTLLKTNSSYSTETINNGKYYPSIYDKPHAVNFVGNYKFSHRFSTSLNMTYSTGRPITLPIAKYELDGSTRVYYSDRNQYRIPDYFRVDFAMNIEGNHKIKKLAHSSWTIGIYNLTGRRNAYSVFFKSENGVIKGYKLSIFGEAIPTITYNFKF